MPPTVTRNAPLSCAGGPALDKHGDWHEVGALRLGESEVTGWNSIS